MINKVDILEPHSISEPEGCRMLVGKRWRLLRRDGREQLVEGLGKR